MVNSRIALFIIAVISGIIGFIMTIQINSIKDLDKHESREIVELRTDLQTEWERRKNLLNDIAKKEKLLDEYLKNKGEESKIVDIMKKELTKAKDLAGLSAKSGHGYKITISSLSYPEVGGFEPVILVDEDLRSLINELFANGSKAIAVNGERIIAISAIRNVGSNIYINSKLISNDIIIIGIGEADKIKTAIEIAGFPDYFKMLNRKLEIEVIDMITVPPYHWSFVPKYMQPVNKEGD